MPSRNNGSPCGGLAWGVNALIWIPIGWHFELFRLGCGFSVTVFGDQLG